MTEEEAKTKWCPHMFPHIKGAKHSGHNCYADENNTRHTDTTKCIGSDCMSWRKDMSDYTENLSTGKRTYRNSGYCGLAGKP